MKLPDMRKLILPFLMICWIFAGAQDVQDIQKLFPNNQNIPGWSIRDSVETYQGDDLFYYINGGADIFLEYGFIRAASCKYENASNTIHLEIYEMEDAESAFGIFSINTNEKGTPVDLGEISFAYDYYLNVWKSKYFIRCTSQKKEVGIVDTLSLFTKYVVDKIPDKGKLPAIAKAIELDGADKGSLKFMEGLIALGNVYNFGMGSMAGFYQGASVKLNGNYVFIFAYADERERREWFASLKGKMNMNKKYTDFQLIEDGFMVIDKSGSPFYFKPFSSYILVAEGKTWDETKVLFEKIESRLGFN
jgi:hypothetical protein